MLIQFKERAVLNTAFLGALEVEMCGENDRITKMPLTSFPSHRGGTRRYRLKFRRGTKKRMHKTPGEFISIYFSLFSRNSGPYFNLVLIAYQPTQAVNSSSYLSRKTFGRGRRTVKRQSRKIYKPCNRTKNTI